MHELTQAVLRPKVALRDEDEHLRGGRNLLLEQRDVRQVVHVEEDADAGQDLLEQLLDYARLVLACLPYVREEEVVALPLDEPEQLRVKL